MDNECEERCRARLTKLWALGLFLAANAAAAVGLLLSSRRVVLLAFFFIFLLGTLPKFLGSMRILGQQQGSAERSDGPSASVQSPSGRWCIRDPSSATRIVAVIPIYHEGREELLDGVRSFTLSRLPFPRSEVSMVFIIDGSHGRDGTLDSTQTETIFALLSVLLPGNRFRQNEHDGTILPESSPEGDDSVAVQQLPVPGREEVTVINGNLEGFRFAVVIKPINRGKRDSQALCFTMMANGIPGIPKPRDAVLIMDSDSSFEQLSDAETNFDEEAQQEAQMGGLARLYEALISDTQLGGVTGEIEVFNYAESIVTLSQWFEYKANHFLSKASESSFKNVQCLAGAFSLLRAEALEQVLPEYCAAATGLWQKNLLDLGEDRTLSTLLLQAGWHTAFVEGAVAKTKAPSTCIQLIKQRRRWSNSTLINQSLLLASLVRMEGVAGARRRSRAFVFCMVLCEMTSSVLFPAVFLVNFAQLGKALFGGWSLWPCAAVLALWMGVLVWASLCRRIEQIATLFIASNYAAQLLVAAQLAGIVFSMLTSFWASLAELSFAMLWVGVLLASTWRHGQLGVVASATWMAAPLAWVLMQPTFTVIATIYGVSNLDDFSWGTR